MAGSLGNYAENLVLDYLFGSGAPATYYIALYTAPPTDAGGGTEVTGGSFARKSVTNNATNFPAAVGGAKANGTDITFVQATGTWGEIQAFGVFDDLTAGNFYGWCDAAVFKTVQSGDTYKIATGDLDITLD